MATPQSSTSSRYSSTPTQPSVREVDLLALVKSRVEEAEILLDNEKYDASSYLCGYAVELALKFKICKRFQWSEYPTQIEEECRKKLFNKDSVKTHDLIQLLCLSGITENDIHRADLYTYWETVTRWNPENRYAIQSVNQQEAQGMIDAVKRLLTWLEIPL